VVLMAHLDHVGARGNTIYFGADDNASGSGTIMSTLPQLQELQKAGKLNRSVIVLLTAAEEKGLVGSRYFIKHPLPGIPLSSIKACYNADMLGRWQLDRMSLGGGRKAGSLGDMVVKANESLGDRKFAVVNRDIDQYESSQDGYNFTQAGIPTVFAFEGLSNPKGGGNLHEDYHQPTDTVDKIIRDNGGDKVRKFRDLTVEVARVASNAATIFA
ncbi:MAG: M28 family metallopeptidase, partial [Myxococcota bacterium]